MFNDPAAVAVLWVLCLFPLGMAAFFLVSALLPGGIRFRPLPVTDQRILFLVLFGIALYIGWSGGNPVFLAFVALSTLALALQHAAPKRWVDGKVAGVWFKPLAIRGLEQEGGRTVVVLELGFKFLIPATPSNQAFLAVLTTLEDRPEGSVP